MAKKKTTEWWDRYTDEERLAYLRGALAELARVEVPVDVRAEPFSAGAETDIELIAGARSRALALIAERRMLRLAVRELDACTWTWDQPPAGTDGPEESWDLIQAARKSVVAAHKYRTGEAVRPEVAALRRELVEAKAVADRLSAELAQAQAERDALRAAIQRVTSADDDRLGSVAADGPDLVARLLHRVDSLLQTQEAALGELLLRALDARMSARGSVRLTATEKGALHAAREQDDYAALGSSIRTDLTVMTAARMAAERALGRVYLFARAGASLSGSGEDKIDRMTSGEAFDVARGALLAIVAESRTWRVGR